MKAAILVIGFNRPALLARVLGSLTHYGQDRRIYIAIDGPREGYRSDVDKVLECQKAAKYFASGRTSTRLQFWTSNKGCKDGPIDGITWFFDNEEEGVILEDDCLPSSDFLPYCDELLDRYRNDQQVWIVAGDNSADLRFNHEYSYTFAPEPLIWGWASWRDRWARYDAEMKDWMSVRKTSVAERIFRDREQYETRSEVFDRVADGKLTTCWDYQLSATIRIHRGLCIVPRHNLVSNIGFGKEATHTTEASSARNGYPTKEIMPLFHPPCIFLDREVEAQILNKIQGVRYVRAWRKAARRMRGFLVELLKSVK
ncbi:hypothetical protein [Synechococcus sp. NB0720_010]|uniref:hypothetical protein n=1 Tax=Synechococcus sp. NB0720_010 TaxID=2907159 RepID=UPI001FFB25B2|nr:hypothetical protein [Synechococcus sp. NB0720_010]UPH89163.1 hypothetical protein LY254_07555 [Synechococcus sp. NB0720_010]